MESYHTTLLINRLLRDDCSLVGSAMHVCTLVFWSMNIFKGRDLVFLCVDFFFISIINNADGCECAVHSTWR